MNDKCNKENIFTFILIWSIWILASLTYFHQYFLRQVVSSLSSYLMHDFFLTIVNLSDLAALFFVSYVITLPLTGILIDRYGVKRILPLALLIAALSCFLFYRAHTELELIIARLLMGGSATFTLMSSYTVIRKYFPENLFPLLSGLTLTIGVTGAVFGSFSFLATKPTNWRGLMGYAGFFALGIAVLFFIIVHIHDAKYGKNDIKKSSSLKKFFSDSKISLKKGANWLPGLYGGFILTPIIAFASFWASPFLIIHYKVTHLESAYLISYIFIGYAAGAPIIAVLAQKIGLKPMMIFSAGLAASMLMLISFLILNHYCLIACLFLLGFTAGAFSLTTILIKLSVPENITASAFSFNTMIAQLVGAFILWLMGQIIYYWHGVMLVHEHHVYSAVILHNTMLLLILASLLALIIACFISSKRESIDFPLSK